MGVMASRTKYLNDTASAVVLRNIADGAEAPSGSSVYETAISLNELRAAYWDNYEIPGGVIAVQINVTAVTLSTNVYTITLRVDDVVAMNNNPVVVATLAVSAVGTYELYVDADKIGLIDSDHSGLGKWLQVGVTESGTPASPSITYGAVIVKDLGK